MKTIIASAAIQYNHAKTLILEYQSWLGIDLCFQGFEDEISDLASMYGPPSGSMILCYDEEFPVGCVGLRNLGEGICEMKRMYVVPDYQGKGLGKSLLQSFLREAKRLNYESIRLDTLRSLKNAISLYKAHGFSEISAYCYNPDPGAIYMEKRLETIG